MKLSSPFPLALAVMASLLCAGQAQEAASASSPLDLTLGSMIEFRHLDGIGLVIWGADQIKDDDGKFTADDASLVGVPKDLGTKDRHPLDLLGRPLLKLSKGDGFLLERTVIVLRLQDSLDLGEGENGPATFTWSRDGITDSETTEIHGALLMDIYSPGIGDSWFLRYNSAPDGYALHLRFGASWDKSGSGDDEVDRRSFFGGLAFMAPDPFTEAGLRAAQRNRMQFGVGYTEDAISGEEEITLELGYNPVIKLPTGDRTGILIGERIPYEYFSGRLTDVVRTEAAAGRSTYEDTYLAYGVNMHDPNRSSAGYLHLTPFLSMENLLDQVLGESEGDFRFEYGFTTGFTLLRNRITVNYKLVGVSDLDAGDNHAFHEVSAVGKIHPAHPLSVTASYRKGELAPSFQEEDLVTVGIAFQF